MIAAAFGVAAAAGYGGAILVTFRELSNPIPREGRVIVAIITLIATALALGGIMTGGGAA